MRVKRVLAVLLTAALTASLLVLPAGAVPGSFRDVADEATAINADILRLMGIVSGVGDNRFEPDGTLTRAQFCTMVVNFLQKGDEASRYATRTIFSDVGGTHWARSYINFAATCSVGSGGGENASTPLVAGVGDGKFMPDSSITLAEAATILLRALGYSGRQAGAVWPQGYLDLAASVGLTEGLPAGQAGAAITRAQATQLFMNALQCRSAGGEVYYKTLGSKSEKAIILAVNAATDDGSRTGAVRVVVGSEVKAYLPAHGSGNPVSLLDRRGELVLNDQDEIVTFLPDNSTRVTAVLNGDAKSGSFKGVDGKQYTVGKDIPVYVASSEEDSGYKESAAYETAHKELVSGTRVTMYAENGKVAAIFAAIPGTSISTDAVVVMGVPSAATFYRLTGGATDFTLRRGEETITLGDLQDYDVVTYDKVTRTLLVSDLRLSCVYGSASPSPREPRKITVLGNEFDVLESAWYTTNSFKPGDSVVLLLTADGKVAGMTAPSRSVRSTAVAMNDGKLELFLPNGRSRVLTGAVSTANTKGRLVTLSGNKDSWTGAGLSGDKAPGDYQVSAAILGGLPVASDVRIYEQAGTRPMASVDIGELTSGSIPASKIAAYRQNSSGIVDFIVLEGVTGNAYEYGMMKSTTIDSGMGGTSITTWALARGVGQTLKFVRQVGYNGKSGDMVGVVTGTPKGQAEGGDFTLASIVPLTEVKGVKPSDFFTSQEAQYVTANGRTYRVASDVECCLNNGGKRLSDVTWLTGETGAERLSVIRAYSDDLTLYVDPTGGQVRVIKAN